MSNKIIVAVIQHGCVEEKKQNIEKSIYWIKQAAKKHPDIVLLPELNSNLYFCVAKDKNNFNLAETIPGPTTEILSSTAKEEKIILVTTIFEKQDDKHYYNTAVVFDKNGKLAGTYRKTHIPDDPGYHEKYYFAPGNNEIYPVSTSVGKLGVMVCWDQWFPEAARLMALAGAELLIYPSAIGWNPDDDENEQHRQLQAWQTIQRGNAIANCLPVITSNRVKYESDPSGKTKGNIFWGSSFIAGPQGEILAQAGNEEQLIFATIDLERTNTLRNIWPFFRDRRIDSYKNLLKRKIKKN